MSSNHELQVEFSHLSARVKSLDLHPEQPWILVSQHSGAVEIWNYLSQKLEKSFEVANNVPVRTARFVAQKEWVVTGCDDEKIRVYDYNTAEKIKEFQAHEDYIRSIVIHPTLPYTLSASDDKVIKLWDWEKDWICIRTFQGHSHYVMQVAINPEDHNNFASVSLDGSAKIWNIDNPSPIASLEAHQKGVNCVNYYFSSSKLYLMTGSDDYTSKIWDYETLSCFMELEGHTNNVTATIPHPELPLIFTGSEDNTIRIWSATGYQLEKVLDEDLGRVWTIEFVKHSNQIVIGFDEGFIVGKFTSPSY